MAADAKEEIEYALFKNLKSFKDREIKKSAVRENLRR